MIKENVKELMCKLDFPYEAQEELLLAFDILINTDFINIANRYNGEIIEFDAIIEDVKVVAENSSVSPYKAYVLLFLCMAPVLHKQYVKYGISDTIFYDTLCDLRYKLDECRLVHGTYGTFVPKWYKGFFEMRIFALGRLQFEINHTWFDCEVRGKKIPKGTKVLSVHIPRTGTALKHNLVLDSYAQAAEFFKTEFEDEIIFICNSWLLYPWNRTVYKDGSNLAQFYDDFTIVNSGEYQNYSEVWRLFDCLFDGNVDHLPNDTSLRRSFIERIKSNQPIGHGTGVIVYNK